MDLKQISIIVIVLLIILLVLAAILVAARSYIFDNKKSFVKKGGMIPDNKLSDWVNINTAFELNVDDAKRFALFLSHYCNCDTMVDFQSINIDKQKSLFDKWSTLNSVEYGPSEIHIRNYYSIHIISKNPRDLEVSNEDSHRLLTKIEIIKSIARNVREVPNERDAAAMKLQIAEDRESAQIISNSSDFAGPLSNASPDNWPSAEWTWSNRAAEAEYDLFDKKDPESWTNKSSTSGNKSSFSNNNRSRSAPSRFNKNTTSSQQFKQNPAASQVAILNDIQMHRQRAENRGRTDENRGRTDESRGRYGYDESRGRSKSRERTQRKDDNNPQYPTARRSNSPAGQYSSNLINPNNDRFSRFRSPGRKLNESSSVPEEKTKTMQQGYANTLTGNANTQTGYIRHRGQSPVGQSGPSDYNPQSAANKRDQSPAGHRGRSPLRQSGPSDYNHPQRAANQRDQSPAGHRGQSGPADHRGQSSLSSLSQSSLSQSSLSQRGQSSLSQRGQSSSNIGRSNKKYNN